MPWFVYVLRCRDGSLYTGITKDVERRLAEHNAGTGAKYTRSHGPVQLAWSKRMRNESTARKREAAIKRLTKQQKETFIDV